MNLRDGVTRAPLTPADCDLRDFAFMPLDVVRLRDSDMAVTADADEFRCAVLLWCASWHQVPAASLPDDDKALAQYAGYGRVVKEWQKVRAGALRGWVKCSDGRLYHPVVAEKAADAWTGKLKQRLKTECARIKKHNDRNGTAIPYPEFSVWFAAGCPVGVPLHVPDDSGLLSLGTAVSVPRDIPQLSLEEVCGVPRETPSKGEGEGQGELTTKDIIGSPDAMYQEVPDHPSEMMPSARNVQIALLLRAQGVLATAQHPIVAVTFATDPRVTDDVLNLAIAKAKAAKPGEVIPVKYLLGCVTTMLVEQAKPAARIAESPLASPSRQPRGMDPKGLNESYDEYQARIDAAEASRRKGSQQ